MSNRFDLEQQILNCWNVTSDLETLFKGVMDNEMSRDEVANVLIGMKNLYDLKFDECFRTFEELIASKNIQ